MSKTLAVGWLVGWLVPSVVVGLGGRVAMTWYMEIVIIDVGQPQVVCTNLGTDRKKRGDGTSVLSSIASHVGKPTIQNCIWGWANNNRPKNG